MSEVSSSDGPQFVLPAAQRIPVADDLARRAPIPTSRMFLIKKSLTAYRAANPDEPMFDMSQGDGGASLPGVPLDVLDRAHALLRRQGTAYDMPYGCDAYRRAVIEQYWKVEPDGGIAPANIVATVGGRDALLKAYEAMLLLGHGRSGDIVLTSRVPWISYNWGPYNVGANVMLAPGDPRAGWAYTSEAIEECVRVAAGDGRKIACLIVTSPDNPTGRTLSPARQAELGRAALRAGVAYVLYDWMYHWVSDDGPTDLSAFLRQFEPAERPRIVILDGITKSLGGSNIRNAHLVADEKLVNVIQARASHGVIPSFHSQAVAMAAFEIGMEKACAGIIGPTAASRRIARDFFAEKNLTAILGQGYYAFVDVGPWLDSVFPTDSAEMGMYLGEKWGLAVVPGEFFSPHGRRWIRLSYALPPETTRGGLQRLWEALAALKKK